MLSLTIPSIFLPGARDDIADTAVAGVGRMHTGDLDSRLLVLDVSRHLGRHLHSYDYWHDAASDDELEGVQRILFGEYAWFGRQSVAFLLNLSPSLPSLVALLPSSSPPIAEMRRTEIRTDARDTPCA